MAQHGSTHPGLGTYLAVFVALLALTALTVAAAFTELGALNVPVALGIAGVKATLVVLFFMHLRYESGLIALYAVSGVVFVVLLLAFTMTEVTRRSPPGADPLGPAAAEVTPRSNPGR